MTEDRTDGHLYAVSALQLVVGSELALSQDGDGR